MIDYTYDDILNVFKSDVKFRKKNLTILFCESMEENYDKYDKKLEEYLFSEACALGIETVIYHFIRLKRVNQEMLNAGLVRAANAREFSSAKTLIEGGADPTTNHCRIMKIAIYENKISFLKKMRKQGFNFKANEEELFTTAIDIENLDACKFLVKAGCTSKDFLNQSLRISLRESNERMIKFFIKAGASAEGFKSEYIKYIYS